MPDDADGSITIFHATPRAVGSTGPSIPTVRFRPASSPRARDAAGDTCDAEVVAEHGNASLAHPSNQRLDVLDVLRSLGSIEQHIVPVGRIDVLDGFEHETGRLDVATDSNEFLGCPELSGIAGDAPGRSLPPVG